MLPNATDSRCTEIAVLNLITLTGHASNHIITQYWPGLCWFPLLSITSSFLELFDKLVKINNICENTERYTIASLSYFHQERTHYKCWLEVFVGTNSMHNLCAQSESRVSTPTTRWFLSKFKTGAHLSKTMLTITVIYASLISKCAQLF